MPALATDSSELHAIAVAVYALSDRLSVVMQRSRLVADEIGCWPELYHFDQVGEALDDAAKNVADREAV